MNRQIIRRSRTKGTISCFYRVFADCLLLVVLMVPAVANATFMLFSDRSSWVTAVQNAGLGVQTNGFSTDPTSGFTLGGAVFSSTGGSYISEGIEGGVLRIGYESGGPLYGFGYDITFGGASTAFARAVDTNTLFGQSGVGSGSGNTFVGILSDIPLSTDCSGFFCISGGRDEAFVSGQPGSRIDNFSVAVFADTDSDGITDSVDNCIEHSNALQTDSDSDGHGNICDADINNDCLVNFLDLNLMIDSFFSPAPPASPDLDLTGPSGGPPDNFINFLDLNVMIGSFFGLPGPSACGACPCPE